MSFDKPIENPCDKNNLIYLMKVCILEPEGRLCYSHGAEIGDISSALKYILKHAFFFRNKNAFIGIDSQSTLLNLEQSPVNKHYYLGIDILSL